jgi:hypothetical protein
MGGKIKEHSNKMPDKKRGVPERFNLEPHTLGLRFLIMFIISQYPHSFNIERDFFYLFF